MHLYLILSLLLWCKKESKKPSAKSKKAFRLKRRFALKNFINNIIYRDIIYIPYLLLF